MCGIAALISCTPKRQNEDLLKMCEAIAHRGPDGQGYAFFSDNDGGTLVATQEELLSLDKRDSRVALGHRRLAIRDVSGAASQPMTFGADRNYWITYNGELYNFIELRASLEEKGYVFRTNSDTEVLICSYVEWGKECLSRFNGMFSFVIYDLDKDCIFAARDRFGVKPLYWWRPTMGSLAFASEIKQFTFLSEWVASLNEECAFDYLNWGLTDHTHGTLFSGVWQVPAGHYVHCQVDDIQGDFPVEKWYQLPSVTSSPSFLDATDRFKALLFDAVKLRLSADVSVGAALSGGLDSSSIVCISDVIRREKVSREMCTFSARATDERYDEGYFIDLVSNVTSTTPHMIYPNKDELLEELEQIIWHHDEPFGSTSVYAEWQVFKEARKSEIKVVLDGHGADETLSGYTSSIGFFLAALLCQFRFTKFFSEISAQRKIYKRNTSVLMMATLDNLLPSRIRSLVRKIMGRSSSTPEWIDMKVLRVQPSDPFMRHQKKFKKNLNGLSRAHLSATSLPMQLKWVDRDSMAHSIESRSPFMDFRLIEFALSLPDHFKFDGGISKKLLRSAVRQILPDEVRLRKDKMGFVTPEEVWICDENPTKFKVLLDEAVLNSKGILNEKALKLGLAMIDGDVEYNPRLWRMICFGIWMKRFNVRLL